MFRRAEEADIGGIMRVIEDGRAFIERQGFRQWTNGYPDRETLIKDIAANNAYVLCDGKDLLGVAVAIEGVEPTYKKIYGGEWGADMPYITVHRTGVAEAARGRGCGRALMAGVEALCAWRGIRCIRVDTHRGNLPMRTMLEGCGFTCRGTIFLADMQERVAYDKLL